MAGVEERRVDAHGHAAVEALGGADQLQPEAELAGIGEVVDLQVLDSLIADVVEVHRRAEREAREDRHLRRGVAAADVVARVGLGEAAALSLGERLCVARCRRAISLRMKFVVPLTIPWIRSIGVAASDSSSTRTTGTTPATAASKRRCTPCSRARLEQLLAVLGEQLLVRGDDISARAQRGEQVLARRFEAADHLDDQLGAGEDLLEAPARARENAGDLRAGDR